MVEIAVRGEATLGEGPTWDTSTSTLLWVDILGSTVHRYDPGRGTAEGWLNTIARNVFHDRRAKWGRPVNFSDWARGAGDGSAELAAAEPALAERDAALESVEPQ